VQIKLFHGFFLQMGLFFLFMFAPNLVLIFNPSLFPEYMAYGYVIGHIFLYTALIYIQLLTVSFLPNSTRLNKVTIFIGWIILLAITTVNVLTMILGQQPEYDFAKKVILYNAAPVVGISIAVYAAVSILPAVIVLIRNGIKNPAARMRSFLLGFGLLVLMTGGPIHDNARTWQLYAFADIVSTFSLIILCTGVMYRFEERLEKTPPTYAVPARYYR
jgi:hypothetical protein